MLCRWCCVHVVVCACCAGGVLYMWYCIHVIHVLLCICGIVLQVLCSRCVTTCVFVVLYNVCVYVWCCTPGVGVCVVLYNLYVYVLYSVMGQAGIGFSRPLFSLLRVEAV